MSEESQPIESPEAEVELSLEDKYAAAGELFSDDLDDSVGLEASTEDGADTGQSEESEDSESAEARESNSEEEDKEADEPPNWKWKKVRKMEEDSQRAVQEAQATKAEAEQLKAELQDLVKSMGENPVEAFNLIAERAGLDPEEMYEKLVRAKIQKGIDSPEMREIAKLKKELADSKKQEVEEQREAEQARFEAQREAEITRMVNQQSQMAESPEHAAKYPNLAALDPADIAGRVRYGINWAIKNNPDVKFDDLMGTLENIAKEQNERVLKRLGARRQESVEPPRKAYTRKTEPSNIPNNMGARTPHRVESSIELSATERQALAAKVL